MEKELSITEFNTIIKKQKLTLDFKFKLAPSKRLFSRLRADLYFDGKCIKSLYVGIPYYLASKGEFPIRSILDLKQIIKGTHIVRVEISGLWSSAGPSDFREVAIEYQPVVRKSAVRAYPTFSRIEVPNTMIIADDAKLLYENLRESWKRELTTRRDRY
jgi:hypothetical protein